MTLIIGFPTKGFVVLGADGEEGGAIHKSSVRKIEPIRGEGYNCAIAGAGDGNFIDLAIQEAKEAIADLNPATLTDIRTTLEFVVSEIYSERIDKLPEKEAENSRFELLCAIQASKDGRAELIRVGRNYSLIRPRPDVIGIGEYLASYLIDTLVPIAVTRRQAERLCAYIMAKAKAHVQGVGGTTQIVVLSDAGSAEEAPPAVIGEDEFAGDVVMMGVRLMFNWMDILSVKGNMDQIDFVADDVAKMMKEQFHKRYEELVGNLKALASPVAPSTPKDDPPALPPSPE